MTFPTDPKERKAIPLSRGCFSYFPDALLAVAQLSAIANAFHNPGEPLHWAKEKSTDEADALARHQLQHIKGELYDTDGVLHATKVAWRALAQLQRLLESGTARLAPPAETPHWLNLCDLPCTCPPAEAPVPCQRKFALQDCQAAAQRVKPLRFCPDCGVAEGERHRFDCLSSADPMASTFR